MSTIQACRQGFGLKFSPVPSREFFFVVLEKITFFFLGFVPEASSKNFGYASASKPNTNFLTVKSKIENQQVLIKHCLHLFVFRYHILTRNRNCLKMLFTFWGPSSCSNLLCLLSCTCKCICPNTRNLFRRQQNCTSSLSNPKQRQDRNFFVLKYLLPFSQFLHGMTFTLNFS